MNTFVVGEKSKNAKKTGKTGIGISIWQLGNTTVRSPMRLQAALKVILEHPELQGAMRGPEGDKALRKLLGEAGIVVLGNDTTYSVGRKWRSTMEKNGFLYAALEEPELQEAFPVTDGITPLGKAFADADTLPARQECVLRDLSVPQFPIQKDDESKGTFSPLIFVLAVMLELKKRGQEASLSFEEFSGGIQIYTPEDGMDFVVDQVLQIREGHDSAISKRKFKAGLYQKILFKLGAIAPAVSTFRDYGDMNIRHLKASGVIQAHGRGIEMVSEQTALINALVKDNPLIVKRPKKDIYESLFNGAEIPVDEITVSEAVVEDIRLTLKDSKFSKLLDSARPVTPLEAKILRHRAELLLSNKKEEDFAERQVEQLDEITNYLGVLIDPNHKPIKRADGDQVGFDKAEAPAYLEWAIWRSFLSMDGLSNEPFESRRFPIDAEFYPINTAPGRGPDLIFEFEDYVLVVEVTLTAGSRQEAVEGTSVRTHVYQELVSHEDSDGKPVYGLFIANEVDPMTFSTFKSGIYTTADYEERRLSILPLSTQQFLEVFLGVSAKKDVAEKVFNGLISRVMAKRDVEKTKEWAATITEEIKDYSQSIVGKA
jgi:AlwI restriction endonuclease.